jgi:hypothetical protein
MIKSEKPNPRTEPQVWKQDNYNFNITKVTQNEREVTQITMQTDALKCSSCVIGGDM